MLNLTIKKTEPVVIHVGGVPIALIYMARKAKSNQTILAFNAEIRIKIDRESVFKMKYPDIDPAVYLAKLEQAA